MALRVKGPRTVADDVLADLARHPGWEILKARMSEYQSGEMDDFGKFLLRNPARLDPLVLERKRGFFAGQRWFLREVDRNLVAYQRQPSPADPDDNE